MRNPIIKISAAVFMLVASAVASAYSFDGNRKGFVLGGGLGFSPYSSWSGEGLNVNSGQVIDTNESGTGPGFNFAIGHGWDERNLIVFEMNMTGWNSDVLYNKPGIGQGIMGAVWYHYFGAPGRSVFTSAGLAFYRFAYWTSSTLCQNNGKGLVLGGGYEFTRHWQIGGYLGFGKSPERYGDWNYTHLNFLVSAVAF